MSRDDAYEIPDRIPNASQKLFRRGWIVKPLVFNEGESNRILFWVLTQGEKNFFTNGKVWKSEIEMVQVSKEIALSFISFCLDAFSLIEIKYSSSFLIFLLPLCPVVSSQ
jgi:hypothetical protein